MRGNGGSRKGRRGEIVAKRWVQREKYKLKGQRVTGMA